MSELSASGNLESPSADSLLHELVDLSAYLSTWLARSSLLSAADMHRLAFECSERVRCILASRRDADAVLLDHLSSDTASSVRLRVACNANCSRETLTRLQDDPDKFVKTAATDRARFLQPADVAPR